MTRERLVIPAGAFMLLAVAMVWWRRAPHQSAAVGNDSWYGSSEIGNSRNKGNEENDHGCDIAGSPTWGFNSNQAEYCVRYAINNISQQLFHDAPASEQP